MAYVIYSSFYKNTLSWTLYSLFQNYFKIISFENCDDLNVLCDAEAFNYSGFLTSHFTLIVFWSVQMGSEMEFQVKLSFVQSIWETKIIIPQCLSDFLFYSFLYSSTFKIVSINICHTLG